jgi:hypothetical protein
LQLNRGVKKWLSAVSAEKVLVSASKFPTHTEELTELGKLTFKELKQLSTAHPNTSTFAQDAKELKINKLFNFLTIKFQFIQKRLNGRFSCYLF